MMDAKGVSLVTPVFRPDLDHFRACAESILNQSSTDWEWHCVAALDEDSALEEILAEVSRDARVHVHRPPSNLGISANTNVALAACRTPLVAFIDQDDLVLPQAVKEVQIAAEAHPSAGVFYSDECKIDDSGRVTDPFFKPDWSPRRLESHMYVGHLLACRIDLIRGIGGLRPEYDGAQDYDLALRLMDAGVQFVHIPKLLYIWRSHAASTAARPESKTWAWEAGRRALQDHFHRVGSDASVVYVGGGCYSSFANEGPWPRVTIVMPTALLGERSEAEGRPLAFDSVDSLLALSDYPDVDVLLVVDRREVLDEAVAYANGLRDQLRGTASQPLDWSIEVIDATRGGEPFNFSRSVNIGVLRARTELVLLLNDDTLVDQREWLYSLCHLMRDPQVGAAGALLLTRDGKVQHAGISVAGSPINLLTGVDPASREGMSALHVEREVTAVTGAAMLTRRSAYLQVGGYSEEFPGSFNDVDYCLKLRDANYRILWTPHCRLTHFESESRDPRPPREDILRFQERWWPRLLSDPYYSSNLDVTNARGDDWEARFTPWPMWAYVSRHLSLAAESAARGAGLPSGYLMVNPDLAALAAASDGGERLREHVVTHGAREGRLAFVFRPSQLNGQLAHESPLASPFDELRYLLANPDVAHSVRNGVFSTGSEHWNTNGWREHRLQASGDGGPRWTAQTIN